MEIAIKNKLQNMGWWMKTGLVLLLALGWYLPAVSDAATVTYYARHDNTTNLGIDGTANLPAGEPSSFTGYPSKAQMATTQLGTEGRHYPTGMTQGVATVIEKWYAPAYTTNAQDISGISASFALRPVNSSDTFQLNVYDYNPAGAAGNKTLVATGTTKTAITSGTTSQYVWTTGNFTISGTGRVALNHRLLVELVYTRGGSTTGVRVYYGVAGTTSSSSITVTETAVAVVSGDTLTASANTAIAASPQLATATNVLMQRFQVAASANNIELNSLTLNDPGTATLIDNAKIYIDTASQATLPASAVLIGNQAAWNGASTAIPLNQGTVANRTVTSGTPKYIYIVYDMNPTMATRTVQSQVIAVGVVTPDTGAVGLTYNSTSITLSAAPADTLTVGTNTAIATNASDSAAGVIMQRLKLDSNVNGDGQVILSSVTLDDGTATATSYANAKVYIDGTAATTLPGTAVLIGSQASFTGGSTVISLTAGTTANRTVTNPASKYLYIVYDMASGQAGNTVQSHVTAVSVASPDTGASGLNYSSTLFTLTAGPVATITSCTGCHGYPPVDGTARNVPSGQFRGSHNTHGATCTVCHVAATNLKHADGNINMAANINNTGGAYSKTATFAVSNAAFSGGTCSGTYCHGQGAPAWGATSAAPVNGFPYSATQCAKCHSGNLATDVTAAKPFYSTAIPQVTANTNSKVGAHTSHVASTDTLANNLVCADCHGNVTLTSATHMNGAGNFVWSNLATKTGALTPTYTAATGICSNIYCHGIGMPGGDTTGTNRAPAWNSATYLPATIGTGGAACKTCHGFPPPVSAGHPAVTIPAGFPTTATIGASCNCHTNINTAGNSYANIFVSRAQHINGTVEVSGGHAVPFYAHATPPFTSCTGCHNASATGPYPAATAGAAPNCRGCHTAADPTVTVTGCTSCHGNPPNGTVHPNIVGSHVKHSTLAGSPAACTICHSGAGAGSGALHGPGNSGTNPAIDNIVFTAAQAGASATWTATTKTCSTTYCHGATLTGGTTKNPVWGTILTGCGLCHGNPPATATHTGATSTQCINCHTHVNATGTGFTNAALHINGTVEGGDCVSCHGVTQPITAAGAGTLVGGTRRAVSLEFAGAWSHKRSAGGAVTKFDCIVCHMEGDMASGSTTAAHKNGLIELRDPDTGLTIKGVTWGGTGAGAYTSTATNMTFNRFSRNLASATIEPGAAATQINLCLKCHDADGALSTSARVPGGTAQKPFATTIAGATYTGTGVTAGGILGGVTDIKASFAPTNSTYHPVMGKQNNSYTQGTRMVAPWNLAKTTGNNTQWGNLMTCWDCHTASGATGVQTSTVTAHGGAVTVRQPVFGTNPTTGTTGGLCIACHALYNTSTGSNHGAGSAFTSSTDSGMTTYLRGQCHACHSSWSTADGGAPVRPFRAQDAHGFDALRKTAATDKLWPVGATETFKPYGFIRAGFTTQHKPLSGTGVPTGSATCSGYGGVCSRSSMGSYTPGGVY